MVNFPRRVSERQRSAEFIWERNVSERSNSSGTNSPTANSWCLVTHRLQLVKNLKTQQMKTFTPSVSKAQTNVCDANRSFTAQWRLHSFFSVRLPNHERLRETFWLHVAFLHHHFSFYFTWTFLSFRFLSNHQNTFVTNQGFAHRANQTCRGRFTRIFIRH